MTSLEQPGSVFTEDELAYLHGERRLARIATVGEDGTPHVVPVGWTHNVEHDTIDVTGKELHKTKKFRDAVRTGRAAIVIDDLASINPFRPRGSPLGASLLSATRALSRSLRDSRLHRVHVATHVCGRLGVGLAERRLDRGHVIGGP